jgi:hypothetical protein
MRGIEELYEALVDDEDVQERHLYSAVLKAAKEVLDTPHNQSMPQNLDVVEYALLGATYDLQDKRKFWAEHNLRQRPNNQGSYGQEARRAESSEGSQSL